MEGEFASPTLKPNYRSLAVIFAALVAFAAAPQISSFAQIPIPLPQPEQVPVYTNGPGLRDAVLIPMQSTQPLDSRCRGKAESGDVRLTAVIDALGRARNVMFEKALANDMDRLALKTVLLARFEPAAFHGTPVAVGRFIDIRLNVCLEAVSDVAAKGHFVMRMRSLPEMKLSSWPGSVQEANLAPLELAPGTVIPDGKGSRLQGVTPPRAIAHPVPPAANGRSGKFSFRVLVDEHGLPQDRQVIESNDAVLLPQVMSAMQEVRYKPAMKDGMPLPTHIEETLTIQSSGP